MFECTCTCPVCAGGHGDLKSASGCELLHVGAGNQTAFFHKSSLNL